MRTSQWVAAVASIVVTHFTLVDAVAAIDYRQLPLTTVNTRNDRMPIVRIALAKTHPAPLRQRP